ncbi:MAG: hypothetical protein P8008_01580 [Gammaproteobacteria bacterium]
MKVLGGWLLVAYCATAALIAALQLFRGALLPLSWIGLALAALPPLTGVLGGRRMVGVAGRPPLLLTILSGLGLVITMAISWRHGAAAGSVHVWAGIAFIGWTAWLRWLRPQP